MKTIQTILLLIVTTGIFAQQIKFYRTFVKPDWDYANAVIERSDGNYLVAGSSRSQYGTDYDISLILVDPLGNTIWDKYLGQSDSMEFAYSLIETSDGNYLAGGSTGMYFPYLVFFDANGDQIRDIRYPVVDQSYGAFSVGETTNGNYYFIQPGPVTTFYVVNPQGDVIQSRSYDFAYCNAVVQTSDMGFMLVGIDETEPGFAKNIMIRTNAEGDTLWTKTIYIDGFYDCSTVIQPESNGFIIAGSYNDPNTFDEPLQTILVRTNDAGDTLWTKIYMIGTPLSISECRFHTGYILSSRAWISPGGIYPDEYYLFITRFDTAGNILWHRKFDGYTYEIGNNVTQTSDGGFLITGNSEMNPARTDAILIKLDSLGDYVLSTQEIDLPGPSKVITYPNPAGDFINICLAEHNMTIDLVRIFSFSGDETDLQPVSSGNVVKVNLSGMAPGMYFYSLKTTNGLEFQGKFMKIR